MRFIQSDGGRADSGYRGSAGDCVVRAISIASGRPYQQVYDEINLLAKSEHSSKRRRGKSSARNGVHKVTYHKYILSLGFEWVPTMEIGSGCRVHLREEELPMGRLIVRLSRHVTAVIDKTIYDTYDPQRGGTRCVYGYYKK